MKKTVLVAFLLLATCASRGAVDLADYPLKVFIGHVTYTHGHGEGLGNFSNPAAPSGERASHGFDFTCDCNPLIVPQHGSDYYRGRWKKDGYEIELVSTEIGSPKLHTCKMKTTVHDWVYRRNENGDWVAFTLPPQKPR